MPIKRKQHQKSAAALFVPKLQNVFDYSCSLLLLLIQFYKTNLHKPPLISVENRHTTVIFG